MTRPVTILDLMTLPKLLGPEFSGPSWDPWRVYLKALFGLEMTSEDWKLYSSCTGRRAGDVEWRGYQESFVCVGRRGGKSIIVALIAVYAAVFKSWEKNLSPGEVATISIVAVDRAQAQTILKYVIGLLRAVEELEEKIVKERGTGVDLQGRVSIEVTTCNFRSIRGRTVVCAICEEIAFWRNEESANPDSEILQALRPSMATTPGAMLICVSSPYAKRGELWRGFKDFYGVENAEVLFWKAPTLVMNPTLPESVVKRAEARDPDAALAEYFAEFRSDIADFVSRDSVEACISRGILERPYVAGVQYRAFVDPSGGAADSFTLAIAHADGEKRIVDATREVRPPFSPDNVCAEFATLLKSYKLSTVVGDRYAGEWPRERFRAHGIRYELSEMTKSDLYVNALPLFNAGRVALLDLPRLINQICALERRTSRQGKDSVDHPPGGHDDLANVVAGVLCLCDKPVRRHRAVPIQMYARPWDVPGSHVIDLRRRS